MGSTSDNKLIFFPVSHRASSSQHLCSLGHMHLDHHDTVFRSHTTAGHENSPCKITPKFTVIVIYNSLLLRTKPCLDLHPLSCMKRSWESSRHLNLIETTVGFSHRSQPQPARNLSLLCQTCLCSWSVANLTNAQFCLLQTPITLFAGGETEAALIYVAHVSTVAAVLGRDIL